MNLISMKLKTAPNKKCQKVHPVHNIMAILNRKGLSVKFVKVRQISCFYPVSYDCIRKTKLNAFMSAFNIFFYLSSKVIFFRENLFNANNSLHDTFHITVASKNTDYFTAT